MSSPSVRRLAMWGGLSDQGIPAIPEEEGTGLDPAGSCMTACFKGDIFLGCKLM